MDLRDCQKFRFHWDTRLAEGLGRTINPTVLTRAEWARRLKQGRSFASRVAAQDKIWIIGTEGDVFA